MKQLTPDSTQFDPVELKLPNATKTISIPGYIPIPGCSLPNINLVPTYATTPLTHHYGTSASTPSNRSLPSLLPFDQSYPSLASSILTALTHNPSATTSLLNLISATALEHPTQLEHSKHRTNSCFPLGRQSIDVTLAQGQDNDQPLDLTLKGRNRSVSPELHKEPYTSEYDEVTHVPKPKERNRQSLASRNRMSKRKQCNQNASLETVVNEPDSTYQSTTEPDIEKPPVPTVSQTCSGTTDRNHDSGSVRQSTKRDSSRLSDSFSNDESLSANNQSTEVQQTSTPTTSSVTNDVRISGDRVRNIGSRRRKTAASRRPFKVFNRPTLITNPAKLLVETAAMLDQNLLGSLVNLGHDSESLSATTTDPLKCVELPESLRSSHRTWRGRRSKSASDGCKPSDVEQDSTTTDTKDQRTDSESSSCRRQSLSTKSMDSLPLKLPLNFDVKLDASALGLVMQTSTARINDPPVDVTQTSSTECNPRMRRFPEMTPKEIKDEAYWEKRSKNNEAARRSRRARKSKELCLREYADRLEQVNTKLLAEIEILKAEVDRLKAEKNLTAAS